MCGTPTYAAPEILAECGYGLKVDVWATGVILYILLSGVAPFSSSSEDQEELYNQILTKPICFQGPVWDGISKNAEDIISHMLKIDQSERYSADEILNHSWIRAEPN